MPLVQPFVAAFVGQSPWWINIKYEGPFLLQQRSSTFPKSLLLPPWDTNSVRILLTPAHLSNLPTISQSVSTKPRVEYKPLSSDASYPVLVVALCDSEFLILEDLCLLQQQIPSLQHLDSSARHTYLLNFLAQQSSLDSQSPPPSSSISSSSSSSSSSTNSPHSTSSSQPPVPAAKTYAQLLTKSRGNSIDLQPVRLIEGKPSPDLYLPPTPSEIFFPEQFGFYPLSADHHPLTAVSAPALASHPAPSAGAAAAAAHLDASRHNKRSPKSDTPHAPRLRHPSTLFLMHMPKPQLSSEALALQYRQRVATIGLRKAHPPIKPPTDSAPMIPPFPLHAAIRENALTTFLHLVENSPLEEPDAEGFTPLLLAVQLNLPHFVRSLVSYSVNLGSPDRRKWTALHFAMNNANFEIIGLLLDHGANPRLTTSGGNTALHLLMRRSISDFPESVECYITTMTRILHMDPSIVDAQNNSGETPLHLASLAGCHKSALYLICYGQANVNMVTKRGESMLMYAVRSGHLKIVTSLLERGANLGISDALRLANSSQFWEISRAVAAHQSLLSELQSSSDLSSSTSSSSPTSTTSSTSTSSSTSSSTSIPSLVDPNLVSQVPPRKSEDEIMGQFVCSWHRSNLQIVVGAVILTRAQLKFSATNAPDTLTFNLEDILSISPWHPVDSDTDALKLRTLHQVEVLRDFEDFDTANHTMQRTWRDALKRVSMDSFSPSASLFAETMRSFGELIVEGEGSSVLTRDTYGFPITADILGAYAAHSTLERSRIDHLHSSWNAFFKQAGDIWNLQRAIFSNHSNFARLIRMGVPASHRGHIWSLLSKAREKESCVPPGYYKELLRQSISLDETRSQIERDLARTYPSHPIFSHSQGEGQSALRRILVAYSVRNPVVGYAQALNFVAAMLLIALKGDEEKAFWLLASLIEDILHDYFGVSLSGAMIDIEVLHFIVERRFPRIFAHLSRINFPITAISARWMLCAFADSDLPTETMLWIWDQLFYRGSIVLFEVSAALFMLSEPYILSSFDNESVRNRLNDTTRRLFSIEKLSDTMDQISSSLFRGLDLQQVRIQFWQKLAPNAPKPLPSFHQTLANLRSQTHHPSASSSTTSPSSSPSPVGAGGRPVSMLLGGDLSGSRRVSTMLGEGDSRRSTSRGSVQIAPSHFYSRKSSMLHPHLFRCSTANTIPPLSSLKPLFDRYALDNAIDFTSFQQIHAILICLAHISTEPAEDHIPNANHFMSTALFQACDVGRSARLNLQQWVSGLVLLGYTWSDMTALKLKLLFEVYSQPDSNTIDGPGLQACIQTSLQICYQTNTHDVIPQPEDHIDDSKSYSFQEFCIEIQSIQVLIDNIYGLTEIAEENL